MSSHGPSVPQCRGGDTPDPRHKKPIHQQKTFLGAGGSALEIKSADLIFAACREFYLSAHEAIRIVRKRIGNALTKFVIEEKYHEFDYPQSIFVNQ